MWVTHFVAGGTQDHYDAVITAVHPADGGRSTGSHLIILSVSHGRSSRPPPHSAHRDQMPGGPRPEDVITVELKIYSPLTNFSFYAQTVRAPARYSAGQATLDA